jgi:hypothetical protein
MVKIQLIILLNVLSICVVSCNKGQDTPPINDDNQSLKLVDVISYAQFHRPDSEQEYSDYRTFNDFDFSQLVALDNSYAIDNKVKVFYNDKKEIIRVSMYSNLLDNDFEFEIVSNTKSNYSIVYAKQIFNDEKKDIVNGFFLIYSNKSYFVTFDRHPFCVMYLDNHLKAISTLRSLKFDSKKFFFKTKVNYSNNKNLDSESFYIPNKDIIINNETLLEYVINQFNSDVDYRFEMKLKLGLVEGQEHIPLWAYNGHHEFDISATPPTRSLEFNK